MLEYLGIDVFDLIVAAVAVSLLPLAVDLLNTLAPQAQIGRIAQESIGYMLVCIITSLIVSALVLWATIFLPFHMRYYSLPTFPHGVFHVTLGLWLLFHCFYHYAQAIRIGPGHPPKPKRQRKTKEVNQQEQSGNDKATTKESGEDKITKDTEKDKIITKESEKETQSGTKEEEKKDASMCKICKAPKPPRAHHCKICQACCLVMDHHCPFLGNCVGQNNQRHFVIWLIFLFLGDFYATCLSITPFLSCVWQLDSFAPNDPELCLLVGKYSCISYPTFPFPLFLLHTSSPFSCVVILSLPPTQVELLARVYLLPSPLPPR